MLFRLKIVAYLVLENFVGFKLAFFKCQLESFEMRQRKSRWKVYDLLAE